MYEVFLTHKVVGVKEFEKFFSEIMRISRQMERAEVSFCFDGGMLRIFLATRKKMPYFVNGADGFVIRKTDDEGVNASFRSRIMKYRSGDTLVTLKERMENGDDELKEARFTLRKIGKGWSFGVKLISEKNGMVILTRLIGAEMGILDLDLRSKYVLRKPEKYLNMAKTLDLMRTEKAGAVLRLNGYPFLNGEYYLNLGDVDFYKHMAVFGTTGAGKTKFLCQMMEQIADKCGDKYHMLVIDPHDAMRAEIGGMDGVKVYDFTSSERGLDLFLSGEEDIISSVDMTMGLIKNLMGDNWNSRLERLVRASLYILIEKNELNFQNMRRLLTDVTYKNACVLETRDYLPESLQEFFGQDFNELRTQYYDATFAKILSFIDELQLTPAFYRKNEKRLLYELSENKVTLVSLSQVKLGEKAVKTLAGLMMNQLFALGMQRKLDEHIILVVDEVAVVENPVMLRFLAEARKYNISVVLAGQYFSQISEELRTAIYANVANYWCFRLNYADAEMMAKYLDIDLAGGGQKDFAVLSYEDFSGNENEKVKMLTTLATQDVVARVSRNGMVLPAVMGRSLDFVAKPESGTTKLTLDTRKEPVKNDKVGLLKFRETKSSILDLMREQSTSRRKVN